MIEHSAWILPAAKELYKNREHIEGFWQSFVTWLLGKKSSVVFTGLSGVGKTVLHDHLRGAAFKQGYNPPGISESVEEDKIPFPRQRLSAFVLPGQDEFPRRAGIEDIFLGEEGVDGVVHVVSNGFIELRDRVARESLIKDSGITTIEKFRAAQLHRELQDLGEICDLLRKSIHKHEKPKWLIIAVTKVDLFYANITQAEEYYSPHGKSEFVERLRTLQRQVGTDNFRWDSVPVCSWLEDFEWNGEKRLSVLKPNERDHYIALLAEKMKRYSE
jgi:GTPase SAR1 family protein